MTTIPYITTHAMGRFITRGAQLSPSPIQRFLRARQVCPAISRRYTRSDTEQRVRYDEELIYIQDVASGAVVTIMERGNNFRWNAMIREMESLRC
ncbi:MAG: hypothetical protein ACRCXB_33370 [Aeromonadaceae bacterium]